MHAQAHTHARTHTCEIAVWAWERNDKNLEVGRIFDNIRCMSGNATSAESKNGFMCTIPTNILTHLTMDKSRQQVHTAVDHARYEVSYRTTRLHTATHPTHSRACVTRTHTYTQTHTHWLGHMPTGTRGVRPHESKFTKVKGHMSQSSHKSKVT